MRQRLAARVFVMTALAIAGASEMALAQSAGSRGWLDLSVGAPVAAERTFSVSDSRTVAGTGGRLERTCDYPLKDGHALDISGGLFIGRYVGAGATFTATTYRGPASIRIAETNPFGTPGISVDGRLTTDAQFQRAEETLNLSGVVMLPTYRRLQAKAFGGPTYIRLRQDSVGEMWPDYAVQYDPARGLAVQLAGVNYLSDQLHSSGWGYHVGGSVALRLTRVLGAALTIRYLHAGVEVRNSLASEYDGALKLLPVKAGGLQILGGAHVGF